MTDIRTLDLNLLKTLDALLDERSVTRAAQRLAASAPDLVQMVPPVTLSGFSKTLAWHERSHRDAGHRWLRALLFATLSS